MARKPEAGQPALYPNFSLNFYEGEQVVSFECTDRPCRFACYDVEPPPPDAECCWRQGFDCFNPHACRAVLEALISQLKVEMAKLGEEE